ncbi:hypothetical protein TNCV_1093591 [Trichonephila clavipes]|nr:hypothetical protein TNCV_1093591 [Trichonephila clavipes]
MDPHNNNPNEPRCTDQEQIFSNLENACLNIIDACDTIEMLCKSEESSSPTSKGWEGETSTSDGMASASDVKQADVKPKDPQPEPEMPTGDAVGECNNRILMTQRTHFDDCLECGFNLLEVSEELGITQSVLYRL